jgi:hypothetical protein
MVVNKIATMQIESSKETGNWSYVVRNHKNERIIATGNRKLAIKTLNDQNNGPDNQSDD